jgi:hypothetical protein
LRGSPRAAGDLVKLVPRPSPNLRCAFCHLEAPSDDLLACPRCHTQLHPSCRELLAACLTVGCERPVVRPQLRVRLPRRRRLAWLTTGRAAVALMLLTAGLAGVLTASRSSRHSRSYGPPAASSFPLEAEALADLASDGQALSAPGLDVDDVRVLLANTGRGVQGMVLFRGQGADAGLYASFYDGRALARPSRLATPAQYGDAGWDLSSAVALPIDRGRWTILVRREIPTADDLRADAPLWAWSFHDARPLARRFGPAQRLGRVVAFGVASDGLRGQARFTSAESDFQAGDDVTRLHLVAAVRPTQGAAPELAVASLEPWTGVFAEPQPLAHLGPIEPELVCYDDLVIVRRVGGDAVAVRPDSPTIQGRSGAARLTARAERSREQLARLDGARDEGPLGKRAAVWRLAVFGPRLGPHALRPWAQVHLPAERFLFGPDEGLPQLTVLFTQEQGPARVLAAAHIPVQGGVARVTQLTDASLEQLPDGAWFRAQLDPTRRVLLVGTLRRAEGPIQLQLLAARLAPDPDPSRLPQELCKGFAPVFDTTLHQASQSINDLVWSPPDTWARPSAAPSRGFLAWEQSGPDTDQLILCGFDLLQAGDGARVRLQLGSPRAAGAPMLDGVVTLGGERPSARLLDVGHDGQGWPRGVLAVYTRIQPHRPGERVLEAQLLDSTGALGFPLTLSVAQRGHVGGWVGVAPTGSTHDLDKVQVVFHAPDERGNLYLTSRSVSVRPVRQVAGKLKATRGNARSLGPVLNLDAPGLAHRARGLVVWRGQRSLWGRELGTSRASTARHPTTQDRINVRSAVIQSWGLEQVTSPWGATLGGVVWYLQRDRSGERRLRVRTGLRP